MTILAKIAAGHDYIMRDMSGVLFVALYYGRGICSSAFVEADGMYGPARPLS